MAEEAVSAETDLMLVTFDDLPDRFTPREDITCSYKLSPKFTPSTYDWIGLYKVGWESHKEYYTFDWAPKASDTLEGAVAFKGKRLPPDGDENAYQFCYVAKDKTVRGVSTSFRFAAAVENDLERLELEEDDAFGSLLVVRSRTAEELACAREEATKLRSIQEQTATERDALKERLDEVEVEREKLAVCVAAQKEESVLLKRRVDDELDAREALTVEKTEAVSAAETTRVKAEVTEARLAEVEREKGVAEEKCAKAEKRAAELNGEVQSLQMSLAMVQQQANQMKTNYEVKDNEVDLFKQRIFELEGEKKAVSEQKAEMDIAMENMKAENILVKDELEREKEEVATLKQRLALRETALEEQTRVAQEHADALTMGLADAKGEREGLMNHVHELEIDLKKAHEDLSLAKQDANVAQANVIEVMGYQEEMKQELQMAHLEISGLKEGNSESTVEQGAAIALRMAHKQLERESQKMRKEVAEMKRELVETKKREYHFKQLVSKVKGSGGADLAEENGKLNEQIADLTRRLEMGADVYKEKYKECYELQTKLKKTQSSKVVCQPCPQNDMDDLAGQVMTAKKVAKNLADDNERLQGELQSAVAALKQQEPSFVHVSTDTNSIAEQMVAEIEERRKVESELRKQIEQLEADKSANDGLDKELGELKARFAEEVGNLKEVNTRIEQEAIEKEMELKARLDESDSTVAQQMQKIDEIQQEVDALRASSA